MRALGIDIAANRALDCVLMVGEPGDLRIEDEPYQCQADEVADKIVARAKPDVVAIDSPPGPGRDGRSREAERDLNRRGIRIFWTPSNPDDLPQWMTVGEHTFEQSAAAGYPLYTKGRSVKGRALEVYPHATAVVLRGAVWAAGTHKRNCKKRDWRIRVLKDCGVDTSRLTSLDKVDAALAAVTGLYALAGEFTPLGRAGDGVIAVPARPVELLGSYEREDP